jgi:hypothetical protein
MTDDTAQRILAELIDIERRSALLRDEVAQLKVRMIGAERQMRRQVEQLASIGKRFAGFDERLARIERYVEIRI